MQITEIPLTREEGFSLIQSIRRFSELSARKIKTSTEEAEQTGLQKHISQQLFLHSSELLGAWIAVIREYQPLIGALSAVLSRVNASQEILNQTAESAKDETKQFEKRA